MTLKKLKTYLGRSALWTPQSRAAGATIRVRVTIEALRQRYGRDEALIMPHTGKGSAWVGFPSLKPLPREPRNLY
jgi:hypothetical protein